MNPQTYPNQLDRLLVDRANAGTDLRPLPRDSTLPARKTGTEILSDWKESLDARIQRGELKMVTAQNYLALMVRYVEFIEKAVEHMDPRPSLGELLQVRPARQIDQFCAQLRKDGASVSRIERVNSLLNSFYRWAETAQPQSESPKSKLAESPFSGMTFPAISFGIEEAWLDDYARVRRSKGLATGNFMDSLRTGFRGFASSVARELLRADDSTIDIKSERAELIARSTGDLDRNSLSRARVTITEVICDRPVDSLRCFLGSGISNVHFTALWLTEFYQWAISNKLVGSHHADAINRILSDAKKK